VGGEPAPARLVKRAAKDAAAVRQMRAEYPAEYRAASDLVARHRRTVSKVLCGENLLARDSLRTRLEDMQRELLGDEPTPLEMLVVEQIATAWLHVQWSALLYSFNLSNEKLTLKQLDHLERMQGAAQRRYLDAIRTLEQVRALQRPAISVQRMAIIGKQQVLAVNGHQQAALSAR
jgi:hypothetical protein